MRIIAGEFRGKKLTEFNYDNIRPTSDIVKEAIFNTLQNEIAGSSFLDLFGGTGNVGLEAISRGAGEVVICDNNANSIKVIKKNNELLNGRAKVLHLGYDKALQKLSKDGINFDIIFLDPPYEQNYEFGAIELIYKLNLLNKDGIIVYEHHKNHTYTLPDYCKVIAVKKYGIKKVTYIVWDEK